MNGKKENHRSKLGMGLGRCQTPLRLRVLVSKSLLLHGGGGGRGDNEGFILGLSITGCTVGRLVWQQNVELAEAGGGETSSVGS